MERPAQGQNSADAADNALGIRGRRKIALVTVIALTGAVFLIVVAVVLSRPLSAGRSGPAVAATPLFTGPGSQQPAAGPTPTAAQPTTLMAVSSQTSALASAAQQLAMARAAIAPALEQVREAAAKVIAPPQASVSGCATLRMLYNDTMNAAVSLTSNTGAALDNRVTSLQGNISATESALGAATRLGASAAELEPASAALASAKTAATQATADERSAEATAATLLASAHASLATCD